jgi:hypothetical protein
MTKVKSSFLQIFKKSRIANYVNSTIKFCELLNVSYTVITSSR